jgi:DNA-binding NarL/FixJ family response regulator
VLVAHPHDLFRDGLCRLLQDETDLCLVGCVETGRHAVELARDVHPEIALVAMDLPDMCGLDVCHEIVRAGRKTHALLVVDCDRGTDVVAAIQKGASGYISRCSSPCELCAAIRLVCKGQAILDLNATANSIDILTRQQEERSLSAVRPRELEILKLVAHGQRNREIAFTLGISERTVHSHLLNIFRRWQVDSRTEAVFRAVRIGLVKLEDLA